LQEGRAGREVGAPEDHPEYRARPIAYAGLGGDDFHGEDDVLGAVPGLAGAGVCFHREDQNVRLRTVPGVQLDGHLPHDIKMIRGLLQRTVLQ
jgi:hypothetical protein